MSNVVVTGGAGFIGSNLCKELTRKHKVSIIDNLSSGSLDNIPKGVDCCVKDINDITPKDFYGIDFVFHCAALARVQMSIKEPIRYNESNINGTLKVLEAARQAKIKKLIYSASSSAYGETLHLPTPENSEINPMSPYALQKFVGEMYCKQYSLCYNLNTVCLRYFNVYGENMPLTGAYRNVIGIFKSLHQKKHPLTITNDGEQRRDFTYVGDVVRANILAMKFGDSAEVINIGSGKNYSVNQIAEVFGGEKKFIGNVIEPRETLADIVKAKKILGWNPKINVIDWLKDYVNK